MHGRPSHTPPHAPGTGVGVGVGAALLDEHNASSSAIMSTNDGRTAITSSRCYFTNNVMDTGDHLLPVVTTLICRVVGWSRGSDGRTIWQHRNAARCGSRI